MRGTIMNNYDEHDRTNENSGSDVIDNRPNNAAANEKEDLYSAGGSSDNPDVGGASYSYRSGEYSYSSKESIPDSKYVYGAGASNQGNSSESFDLASNTTDRKKKKIKRAKRASSGGKAGLIALLIVAAVLLSAVAGFGGAMLAQSIFDGDKPQVDIPPENAGDAATSDGDNVQGSSENEGGSVIIVKDNNVTKVETVTGNIGDEDLTLAEVVTLVKDSVVEIFTEVSVYNGRYVQSGAGSGVIIGTNSVGGEVYVVTNNHVIEDADTITVRLANGNEYTATLRGTDATSDLAVLKIKAEESVTVAEIGCSANLVVGEDVVVIGNPLGKLGGSVTNGIISALARAIDIDGVTMTLLQTSAAVNPGNSGGGLFNMKGQLVGVVNAKSGGSNIDNIGFAIPSDTAYDIIYELITYGYVTGRVDTGLTLIDITDTYTAWYYGVSALGVYVYDSKYSDEIQSGDRIVSVNGAEVSTAGDINGEVSGLSVGDTVVLRISRKGKQFDVNLTLREYVPSSVSEGQAKDK